MSNFVEVTVSSSTNITKKEVAILWTVRASIELNITRQQNNGTISKQKDYIFEKERNDQKPIDS